MTPIEIDRLARAAASLRPDWRLDSLRTRMAKFATDNPHRAYGDTAHALVEIALDPATKNPGRLDEAGPWWDARPGAHERPRPVTSGPTWQSCHWHPAGHSSDECPGPGREEATPETRDQALASMRTTLAGSRPIDDQGRRELATDAGTEVDTP